MPTETHLVQLLLAITVRHLPEYLESLLAEVRAVGDDLLRTESHRGEVWFFRASISGSFPFAEDLLDRMITQEPFAGHLKVLFDEFGKVRSGRPAMGIVLLGQGEEPLVFALLNEFDLQVKLIVLFRFVSMDHLRKVLRLFTDTKLVNILYYVIYPKYNQYQRFSYMPIRDLIQMLPEYQSLQQVFPEQIDFAGKQVVTCTYNLGFYSEVDPLSGKPRGLDFHLVDLVIQKMNGTMLTFFLENPVCDDKCIINFGRWLMENAECGLPVLPMQSYVIVVPRGTALTVYELLVAPFSLRAWCVIILVTILGLVLAQQALNHSAMSLFLLIICGIEDSSIRQKNIVEKMIISGGIIIAFLLLSAYDAKITSYLANWPYLPDVSSIDDLRSAGFELHACEQSIPDYILEDPRLGPLILHSSAIVVQDLFENSQRAGFLGWIQPAQTVLRKLANVDRRTGRAHFVMLEHRFGGELRFFYFGCRNLFRARFAELQQRMYESGFDLEWLNSVSDSTAQADLVDVPPKMILFEQLMELKAVFLILWITCCVVFAIELIYFRLNSRRTRMIKMRFNKVAWKKNSSRIDALIRST